MTTKIQVLNTSFPGADVNPIGGIWSTLTNFAYLGIKQVSNQATNINAGAYSGVYDNTNTYTNDQYCIVTMGNFGSYLGIGDLAGPVVRVNEAAGSAIRWQVQQGTKNTNLAYASGGTFSNIQSSIQLNSAAATNDIFELDAVGQVYSLYHTPIATGVQYLVGSFTDGGSHVTAGTIGFVMNEQQFADNTVITNVTAGNLITYTYPIVFAIT